jgi:hypothetical protein
VEDAYAPAADGGAVSTGAPHYVDKYEGKIFGVLKYGLILCAVIRTVAY